MSFVLNGYHVERRVFWETVKLAKIYTFRHHTIMQRVREDLKDIEAKYPGDQRYVHLARYQENDWQELLKLYQADPDFVNLRVFDNGVTYFVIWKGYMDGFDPSAMIEELNLPWKHNWYDSRVGEGNISWERANEIIDDLDERTHNDFYFSVAILRRQAPINSLLYDLWPPVVKDHKMVGTLLHDGMEVAPIPVFVDYDARGG